MKKWVIWIVPFVFALGLSFYHIFGKTQLKEVGENKMETQKIRKAVVAGSWYPGEEKELRQEIKKYFDNAKIANIKGNILALVSPHAGYAYSGFTAANSYKQIVGHKYDVVIVLAPSHREKFYGASVYNGDGYETPLGVVPVEKDIVKKIVEYDDSVVASMDGHREEHSLEIQLPFLQYALSDLKIVPISMWDYSRKNCQTLAKAITNAVKNKNVLLIASTDLYHGYSYDECKASDDKTINKMLALKPMELCKAFEEQSIMACGGGPVVVAEQVALNLGADKAKILFRTNSGDVTGEKDRYVVGYAAIAVYQSGELQQQQEKVGVELGLSDNDKSLLLKIARQSLMAHIKKQKLPKIEITSPILEEKRGAFVTLTKNGSLRGCIGYIFAVKPLGETVQEMAGAAALRDPRFPPVEEDEIPNIEIEISVLTPIREIENIEEIKVGTHGIIIEKGYNSGLLLPQVATEYGWDRVTFLEHTCRKAGLPLNAWRDPDTKIKIFSADVFHE